MSSPSRTRQELLVGLVVIVAIVILVAGLLYLQEVRLTGEIQDLQVRFSSVGGLGSGDPVHVRGIPMGKVKEIELTHEGVIVRGEIHGRVVIHEDATFQLSSVGLMGERIVALNPGTGAAVQDPSTRIFEGL